MSIYIQKQDELFINTEGLAGTSTKPGIFLFRSSSLRDHTTAISSSVNHIIAITCSSNVDSVLTKLSNTNAYAVITITSGSSNGFELTSANKLYNGDTGTSLGYLASAFVATGSWNSPTLAYFTTSSIQTAFSGSLQEIRYYNTILNKDSFKDYVMNPLSIEGNTINSSPDELAFRAPLGSELDRISSSSIHPKITGSWPATQSFAIGNSNYYYDKER